MARPATPREAVSFSLEVEQPYDADSLLDFLGRRTVEGMESVEGRGYARTLRLPGGPGAVRLEIGDERVEGRLWVSDPDDAGGAIEACRRLLDLETDFAAVERHLSSDPALASSVQANSGLRVPGHVDGFEAAVRAVVGQQISVVGARTILGRLVMSYGEVMNGHGMLTRLFPAPEAIAVVDPQDLPMPRSRGGALVAVAQSIIDGELRLDRSVSLAETKRVLLSLRGIGPWTADYIALRALGDPDIFLATDLGVRHGLVAMGLDTAGPEVFRRWSPWRSYALMHVWKSLDGPPR